MPESFEVEAVIPAGPERVYAAWLDTKEHGAFTGAPALVEPWVGGRFTAHDGYLHGITLQLEPGKRIVQSWRSTEFPQGTPDSRIYVDLSPVKEGTLIRIKHVDVPMGQTRLYKPGWLQRYFKPMSKYFAGKPPKAGKAKAAPAGSASAPKATADILSERTAAAPAGAKPAPGAAPAARRSAAAAPAAKRPAVSKVPRRSAAPSAAKRSPAASGAKGAAARRASSRTPQARTLAKRSSGGRPAKHAAGRRPVKPARASAARSKPGKAKSSAKKAARKSRR